MEGGGVDLSYMNGIGGAQQFTEASEIAASSSAGRTAEAGLASGPTQDSGSGIPQDDAKLSATAGVVAQALLGSDVRTEKVAALQQAITAGTYGIPAVDVAAKVVSALLR